MLKTVRSVKILILLLVLSILTAAPVSYAEVSKAIEKPSAAAAVQAANSNEAAERVRFIANPKGMIEGHRLIAQNDTLQMYFMEETLSVIIRDINTGAVMYSTVAQADDKDNKSWQNFMKSGVVMEYLTDTNIVIYRADMFTQNPQITVIINENGFSAKIEYSELKIAYELHVALTQNGFTAEIPQDKIVEDGEKHKVAGFYVYPFLGYSKLGNRKGYMFIPDGPGALIYLENNHGMFKQPYSEMVYGGNIGIDDPAVLSLFEDMQPVTDPEKILAPVFGMVHADSEIGYLGIIEQGGYSAKIEAYPNGAVTQYDWISAKFIYRQVYNQPTSKTTGTIVVRQKKRNDFDIKLRYEFVTGEEANYTGLAKRYRDYLLDNSLISRKDNEFKLRIDLLGAEKKNWLLFKRTVKMTSAQNAGDIIKTLKGDGVANILPIYKGWQKGGISGGLPIYSLDVEKGLGGNKGIKKLRKEMKALGVELYLANDALRLNPGENMNSSFSIVKKLNKRVYVEEVYKRVYPVFNYLLPEKSAQILADSMKSFQDNGFDSFLISGISNILFSYSYKDEAQDRISTAEAYEAAISQLNRQSNLLLEQPFSYLWKYTAAIVDMPTESSDYIFTDEDIPFFAIALKGIIPMYSKYANFQANQNEFLLKLLESGIYPSFYITWEDPARLQYTNSSNIYSSKFERYRDTLKRCYDELKAVNDKVVDAYIVKHVRHKDVARIDYSNGVALYINFGKTPVTAGGLDIGSKSYKVVDAG